MSNLTQLIRDAMVSSQEGYASAVIDSIVFEQDRKLNQEECTAVEKFVDGVITAGFKAKEVGAVACAALDYIDALPKDVVATLPAMPGLDRDWAENVLADGVPDEVLEQAAPVDRSFTVDMSGVVLQEDSERKEEAINALRYPALQRITSCRVCGSESLTWDSAITTSNGVQQGRLTTQDVSVLFYLGCDECSETLAHMSAEDVAAYMNIRQKWGK